MLQFRRTFETEKHQLQELNNRLGHYLSRTKILEQENACLITEINKLKQEKTLEWEHQYKAEMRELRRMVGQLAFEKSQAEMERERLWREFQMVQAMCSEETVVCKDIGGDIKGCEKQLQLAHNKNGALEERLLQLENECQCMEDAHRQEIDHLRNQVHSRVVVTQKYLGPPAVSTEEVQEYARSVSESWIDTFEMYQKRVDEMEESVRADQARLDDLQREKMHYISELKKLRAEAENQSQIQIQIEEQLIHMQENYREDVNEYQMIMEQLEQERRMLASSMAERVREHQELLQVKMDLGMEVAAYRALLEGGRMDSNEANMRANHHQRERIIDIKMPSQPYTPRASTSTRQDLRTHLDVRNMESTSSLRRYPVSAHYGSTSPSRVIPISVTGRAAHQSPAARRDMVSFSKASQAAATASASTSKPVVQSAGKQSRDVVEERSVRIKEVSRHSEKDQFRPIASHADGAKSVKVVSPTMMCLNENTEDSMKEGRDADAKKRDERGTYKISKEEVDQKDRGNAYASNSSEKKVLDSVSVEEIIEKVMRPAGLDAKVSSSGDSKITYHVEKKEQEDGSTKTQIIFESKVEEEVDMSQDSALEDLFKKGVKNISMEDIKGTPTESMIQNLLSLGLMGGDMTNKSVNVEIIEEPVESLSEGEEDETDEQFIPKFKQPSSMFFQIEELENVPHASKHLESEVHAKTPKKEDGKNGSVRVQEEFRDTDSPYFSHDQESQEYFVSTPDDNMSEPEDSGGFASYGHYGVVDDLSDERYYQEGALAPSKMLEEDDESDLYKFMTSDHSFVKEGFPECIIEEEVHVSPTVQDSMLGFLREESLTPTEQLRGALEQLHGSVSGSLKEELALLTRAGSDSPQNLSVKKVQQSSDNGTTTIVAEMNVSQTLEDSGLLGEQGDDLSEEEIMEALQSSNPGLQKEFQRGAEGGYSFRVSRDPDNTGELMTEVTEKHIKLGPSEKSFTFQMDVNNTQAQGNSRADGQPFSTETAEYGQVLQPQMMDPPLKVIHEKRIATVYLESSNDE
ncbi:synemin isoform X1 [Osmerus eperlanus]|uniref:synemin isoform X1 n=1 Tax=Osmerus eperlanus TaxID=29151 RepID=UPI002E0F99EC